jgi:hypothetical protein
MAKIYDENERPILKNSARSVAALLFYILSAIFFIHQG